jgi:hypothetical protein
MKMKTTHALRMEFANAIRGRYAAAAHKDKRRKPRRQTSLRIPHVRPPVTELREATRHQLIVKEILAAG